MQSKLLASLARLVSSGLRAPPLRSLSFRAPEAAGPHAVAAAKMLRSNLLSGLGYHDDCVDDDDIGDDDDDGGMVGDRANDDGERARRDAGRCMYLGNQIDLLYA